VPKFLIMYDDPELEDEIREFETSVEFPMTAREWAEDYAYNKADKGRYEIKELK